MEATVIIFVMFMWVVAIVVYKSSAKRSRVRPFLLGVLVGWGIPWLIRRYRRNYMGYDDTPLTKEPPNEETRQSSS